ncbi:excisionase [Janibacter sp. G1551]
MNVSQATLSRWRRERIGPPFLRVGGVSRYNPATVRAWVTEQEQGRDRG